MSAEAEIQLFEATEEIHYQVAGSLFVEYSKAIGIDLSFQNFEKELKGLTNQYSRPDGIIILASKDNKNMGCVAVRKFEQGAAELKRMYVKDEARGLGLGQKLLDRALIIAKELGYKKILLDTLATMKPAISLYEKNGFYEIESYRFNPFDEARYFEKKL